MWTTSDLALAAWVACRVGDPNTAERAPSSRSPWVLFSFEDEARCREVALEYPRSESYLFDSTVRALRKISLGFNWTNYRDVQFLWSTCKLSLAAFAVTRGAALCGMQPEGNGEKALYRFLFSDGNQRQILDDWNVSESRHFDEQLRRLKRLA